MRRDVESAADSFIIIPPDRSGAPAAGATSPSTTGSRIWFIRRWRSMPRLFQLYLMIACIAVLLLLSMISFTGGSLSATITKSQDDDRTNDHKVLESLPRPDKVMQREKDVVPNGEKVIPDQQSQKTNDKSDDSEKVFSFDPANSFREISYEADLKHQKLTDDQRIVVAAMKHSWTGYHSYAWGGDSLKPISRSKHEWFHTGLTIIDSMDTILLMGEAMHYAFDQSMDWLQTELTFDQHREVNCFEMTIRVLGGLLSAFRFTRHPDILHKTVDVADRLIHCFDSGSKVPFSDVNLRTKTPAAPSWSPDSSLSEVSSMQLEFRDVSRITGDDKYEKTSFATSEHLHDIVLKRKDPLLPMYINPNTGNLSPGTVTLGARGDSYYEYLLKQYLQTNIDWLRDDYLDAIDGVKERLMRRTIGPQKLLYVSEILRSSSSLNPKMDHLTCFLPGTLALGYYHMILKKDEKSYRGHSLLSLPKSNQDNENKDTITDRFTDHLSLAEDLAKTCFVTYNMTATGLAPEITYFATIEGEGDEVYIKPADRHNLLRPEYVESLFYLYHITGKEVYRDQGRQIMSSFNKYCRVPTGGYTSIDDVTNPDRVRPRDMMESFWPAETLKYLFLLFSDDKQLIHKILNHYVFNTEGHLLPLTAI